MTQAIVAFMAKFKRFQKEPMKLHGDLSGLREMLTESGDNCRMFGKGQSQSLKKCFGNVKHGIIGAGDGISGIAACQQQVSG